MQAKVEIISLAYAKQLLEQNTKNRPLSVKTVNRYAADMKAGRWNNNGQGIVITPEGELLDGQHRIAAVIQSQTPTAMLVVRGVPKETFVTMDSGKARSLADVLAIEGHGYANTLAAAARIVYNYASGANMQETPTKVTLENLIAAHPYGVEAAAAIGRETTKFSRGVLAAVIWLGNERRNLDDEVAQFIDGVVYGERLVKGDARHTLREWLIAQRANERHRLGTGETFGAMARAWNAYAAGKELLMIKGIVKPTQASIKIYGFERSTYRDVPDIVAAAYESRRSNLSKRHATAPLRLESAA